MKDTFKIHVEQLKSGKVENIEEKISPDFLEVEEPELSFPEDVHFQGQVYVASDGLVVHGDIFSAVVIPCSICNEPVRVDIEAKGFYHVEPLENIKAGIFDITEVIRENVLLEVPAFAECEKGHCPRREELGKYLKGKAPSSEEDEGYHPFTDLKLD